MLKLPTPHVNRDGVLPFTLSEVFALLFFVLALFLAIAQTDLRDTKDAVGGLPTEVIQGLSTVPPDLLSGMVAAGVSGKLPENWTTLVEASDSLLSCQSDVNSCRARADSVRKVLDSIADITGRFDPSSLEGLGDTELADSIRAYLREAAERLAAAAPRRPGPEGYGQPTLEEGLQGVEFGGIGPCWSRPRSGARPEIVYVLNVVLQASTIGVTREWPDDFQLVADTVPGLARLSQAGVVSYGQFRELALPVFEWSKVQDPECRHFVVMYDSVESPTPKDDFKVAMLTVEDFFYKYLVR